MVTAGTNTGALSQGHDAMSQSGYNATDHVVTPAPAPVGAPSDSPAAQPSLSDRHRQMLEVESGISPEMIAGRGYWTATTAADLPDGFAPYQRQSWMFPILVIPQWNSAGRRFAYVLRPDHPRRGQDGKRVKYEAMPGAPVGFDIHPAMVPLLRDPSVPISITEGSKKADSMASRGLPCLSLNGVYGFLHKRVVVSELDEIALDDRIVRLIFDSDVMTKPSVADALNRLAGATTRRGATVEAVYLPDTADDKTGVDDFLVGGGTPADLDTLTRPWEVVRQPVTWDEPPETDIDHWKPRALRAEADLRALILLHDNPHLTEGEKTLIRRCATEGAAKASRGECTEDGRVRMEPRFLANDHRPEPERGASRAKANPDGTRFLMPRSSVMKTAKRLRGLNLIPFDEGKALVTRKNGRPYTVPELLITPPASIADFVAAAAWYAPAVPVTRADYGSQRPCSACGEVHERTVRTTRRTYCGTPTDPGCGAQIGETETVVTLPLPPANRPEITEDQRARLDQRTGATSMSTKNVGIQSPYRASPPARPHYSYSTQNVDIEPGAAPNRGAVTPTKNVGIPPEPQGSLFDPVSTSPPPGWEDERRRLYGDLYRGAS